MKRYPTVQMSLVVTGLVVVGCDSPTSSDDSVAISPSLAHANGAAVLFDNGSFSGPQELRNASGPFTIFEDFRIEFDATVTGIEWSQLFHPRAHTHHTPRTPWRWSVDPRDPGDLRRSGSRRD